MTRDYQEYLNYLFKGKEGEELTQKLFTEYSRWVDENPTSLRSFLQYYEGFLWPNMDRIVQLLKRKKTTFAVLRGGALEEFIARVLQPVTDGTSYDLLRDQNILAWMGFVYDEHRPKLERSFQRADLSICSKKVSLKIADEASFDVWIPKVVIECKSWVDKPQLRSVSQEANDFRSIFPELVFYLVTLSTNYRAVDERVIGRSIDKIFVLKSDADVDAMKTEVRNVLES
jgi:hypothetical protein